MTFRQLKLFDSILLQFIVYNTLCIHSVIVYSIYYLLYIMHKSRLMQYNLPKNSVYIPSTDINKILTTSTHSTHVLLYIADCDSEMKS